MSSLISNLRLIGSKEPINIQDHFWSMSAFGSSSCFWWLYLDFWLFLMWFAWKSPIGLHFLIPMIVWLFFSASYLWHINLWCWCNLIESVLRWFDLCWRNCWPLLQTWAWTRVPTWCLAILIHTLVCNVNQKSLGPFWWLWVCLDFWLLFVDWVTVSISYPKNSANQNRWHWVMMSLTYLSSFTSFAQDHRRCTKFTDIK